MCHYFRRCFIVFVISCCQGPSTLVTKSDSISFPLSSGYVGRRAGPYNARPICWSVDDDDETFKCRSTHLLNSTITQHNKSKTFDDAQLTVDAVVKLFLCVQFIRQLLCIHKEQRELAVFDSKHIVARHRCCIRDIQQRISVLGKSVCITVMHTLLLRPNTLLNIVHSPYTATPKLRHWARNSTDSNSQAFTKLCQMLTHPFIFPFIWIGRHSQEGVLFNYFKKVLTRQLWPMP